jgi:hypothetical protein
MNNSIILNDCIEEYKKINELTLKDDDIFELFSLGLITSNYELTYEDIENTIVDGGLDGGIDSIIFLVDDFIVNSEEQIDEINMNNQTIVSILISQVKASNTFKEAVLDKLFFSMSTILDLETTEEKLYERFNSDLIEKINMFRKLWRKSVTKRTKIIIDFYYICKAENISESNSFLNKVESIKKSVLNSIQNSTVNYKSFSSKELLDIYNKPKSTEFELECKENPLSVSFEDDQLGYIAVSKLNDFYKFLINEEGIVNENIFESNIRHYQGEVDVNKKIKESLETDFKRDFWWLNNGVTIIASSVGQIGKKLSLKDVQIVNGLQTSYTIGKYYKPEENTNENRSILLKIIINKDQETIDKIISATNQQNYVSPILLRATEETQRKIELYFSNKGYYYDRRKNFYKNQGKPVSKIFGIQSTAQAIQTIMNFEPDTARSKPTTLIKSDESYNKIFDENIDFQIYLNCCLIHLRMRN